MLKIGEFSRIGHVTIRALHVYDEMGLLRPAEVDVQSGYRYYTLEQVGTLNRILALKDLGFGLDQIKRLLAQDLGPDELRAMLLTRQGELETTLAETSTRLARIALRLKQMEREATPGLPPDVSIRSVPGHTVAGVRSRIPTVDAVGSYCHRHMDRLERWCLRSGLRQMCLTMNLYHVDEYRETDLDMESVVVLPSSPSETPDTEIEVRRLPAEPQMASLVGRLAFAELPLQITALLSWVSQNGYELAGPLREIHLFGDPRYVSASDPVVMELQVPVRPRTLPEATR